MLLMSSCIHNAKRVTCNIEKIMIDGLTIFYKIRNETSTLDPPQRSSSQVTLHGFRAQPYILSHHTNMQVIIKCCLIPSRYSASQSCLVPSLFQLFLFLHFILLLSLRSMPPLRNNHFIYHTSTRKAHQTALVSCLFHYCLCSYVLYE